MPEDKVTIRDVYEQVSGLRKELQDSVDDLRNEVKGSYVTNKSFEDNLQPIKMIVYGLAGSSLLALLTFMLNQVFGIQQ